MPAFLFHLADADLPDFKVMVPGTLAVYDHVRNEIEVLTTPCADPDEARQKVEDFIQGKIER